MFLPNYFVNAIGKTRAFRITNDQIIDADIVIIVIMIIIVIKQVITTIITFRELLVVTLIKPIMSIKGVTYPLLIILDTITFYLPTHIMRLNKYIYF